MVFNIKILIVLLLIISIHRLALSFKNQIIHNDGMNKVSCSGTVSYFTVCPNSFQGNISFLEPYLNDCDVVIIDMNMNLSDFTGTRYFHHYRGNITTYCGDDISTYTIIGHVYFDEKHFNGTASMCNDDCSDMYFDGKFKLHAGNATCHNIVSQGVIC